MTATLARARVGWVDRLRGLAVVLMVLDHVLVQVAPGSILRVTVTRLALPAFMVCAAYVWTGRLSGRTLGRLAVAAGVEVLVLPVLGMGSPGIVTVFLWWSLILHFWPAVGLRPVAVLVLGLVQALYLPVGWSGYEVGLVAAWWALGRLGRVEIHGYGVLLPERFEFVGRHPLGWYVGHLLVLLAAVVLW